MSLLPFCSVAVYAESSQISSKISSLVSRRWTKVLRVWNDMRVLKVLQKKTDPGTVLHTFINNPWLKSYMNHVFWLLLSSVTSLPAHPDRAEAALSAGGGSGGVSSGSPAVHRLRQRSDRLPPVSSHRHGMWLSDAFHTALFVRGQSRPVLQAISTHIHVFEFNELDVSFHSWRLLFFLHEWCLRNTCNYYC